ncbi:MAG: response regulator [Lachnospiraceae bacterium]|nr:response regulator [Lachnospiraceae bacterium]
MKQKMKMILADDEVVITKGIQKLVDWNAMGITISGVYEDGKSAFEAIVKNQPELALLDISMPGMTGIEIIRECVALKLDTQFIFISGFQDFEYAKSAIKYGAVDYLLKPVILEELMHAVEQGIANITGIRKEPEQLFMDNRDAFTRLVEVENTCYVPVLADIIYPASISEQMKKLIQFSFYSFVDEYIGRLGIGITFNRAEKLIIVLKGMEREQCFETIQKLQEALEENIRQKSVFVVGQLAYRMSDIPNLYEKCVSMSGYFFFADWLPHTILDVSGEVYGNKVQMQRFQNARDEMVNTLVDGIAGVFDKRFSLFATLVCKIADGKREDACFYYCTAVRLAAERLAALGVDAGYANDMKKLLEMGRAADSYTQLVEVYRNILIQLREKLQNIASNSEKQNYLKAKAYIEEHYAENLTLNILAEEIHMNPYYFSAFFKKNAGINFKDYVCAIRLEHAIPLLVSSDKKTYEIAVEVGFTDARTFTEAFQKHYQETPNAYRKRIKGE